MTIKYCMHIQYINAGFVSSQTGESERFLDTGRGKKAICRILSIGAAEINGER